MFKKIDKREKSFISNKTFLSLGLIVALTAMLLTIPSYSEAKKDKKADAPNAPSVQTVWPAPPDKPRIEYLDSFIGEPDFRGQDSALVRKLLGRKDYRTQIILRKPLDIAVNSDGVIFVSDNGLGAVISIDEKNLEVKAIGVTGPGQLATPTGITIDRHNNIYVCDSYYKKVFVYDPNFNLIFTYGGLGDLERPVDVALDEDRNLVYVSDTKLHVIRVFQLNQAAFVKEIGKRGTGPLEFNFPSFLTTNSQGDLFVVDSMNFRVQVINRNHELKFMFGQPGSNYGTFSRPKGIALDTHGNIYVVDSAFGNFQIFDTESRPLLAVGRFGAEFTPGVFNLPAGIWVDKNNKIYIADQLNKRVQIFQLLDASMDNVEDDAAPQTPPQPR